MKNYFELKDNLYDFIEERLHESYSNLNKKKEYKEIQNKYIDFLQKIEKELSNNVELVEDFTSSEADLYTMQLQEAYKTGLKDSIYILIDKEL